MIKLKFNTFKNNKLDRLKAGSAISVYYKRSEQYFPCTIIMQSILNKSIFQVEFDNQVATIEWINLLKIGFFWLDTDEERFDTEV